MYTSGVSIFACERLLIDHAMAQLGDAVASTVLSAFEALPDRCKPRHRADGTREWVVLSGIVVSQGRVESPCAAPAVLAKFAATLSRTPS
jgi:hypothetical protein